MFSEIHNAYAPTFNTDDYGLVTLIFGPAPGATLADGSPSSSLSPMPKSSSLSSQTSLNRVELTLLPAPFALLD